MRTKKIFCISLDEEIAELGKVKAVAHKKSFSAFVEELIKKAK